MLHGQLTQKKLHDYFFFITEFMLTYVRPRKIISDQGSVFRSVDFKKFGQDRGIYHHLVAVRHPWANGQVERANATVLSVISTDMKTEKNWDVNPIKIEFFKIPPKMRLRKSHLSRQYMVFQLNFLMDY